MIEEATAVVRKQRVSASRELGAGSFLYRAVVRQLQTCVHTLFKFHTTYDEDTNLFEQVTRGFDPNNDAMKPLAEGTLSSSWHTPTTPRLIVFQERTRRRCTSWSLWRTCSVVTRKAAQLVVPRGGLETGPTCGRRKELVLLINRTADAATDVASATTLVPNGP